MDDLSITHSTDMAIVGMSGRFPGAATLDQFWENLSAGRVSIRHFSPEELAQAGVAADLYEQPNYVPARGVLDDADKFDAEFFGFNPTEAAITDPQHRVLLECAWEALENAGYVPGPDLGPVGVFAGAGTNHYAHRLLTNPQLVTEVGDVQIGLATEPDFVANRIAYKLGLTGPAVTIQTACSTALVGVHMACLSLQNFECDMALAGGVSIRLPQQSGYLYQPGSIMSADGYCRAFDADADGTVSGNGVGVVALKRLTEAVDDGDTIYAVIKGTAINNDGALKVGYTAPSIEGQAQVIMAAQALAGVSPATIGYVETHGTATRLGDPVEIAALTQAFRVETDAKNFCAIGSVKTNVGHLNTAAGIAGLIKTVLALTNQKIPPSLNFSQPNPDIDFASSPFYVNTSLKDWLATDAPRRAGVSSFGMGGTNAHAVLEEAPPNLDSRLDRPWHLILCSGRTRSALDMAAANMADHLRDQLDQNLADVAFTTQMGRRAFEHRRMMVCQDNNEAADLFETSPPQRVFSGTAGPPRPLIYLCTGLGDHYLDMGLDLYRHEPVFRAEIDRCTDLLHPLLGLDLRSELYPSLHAPPATNDAAPPVDLDLRQMLDATRPASALDDPPLAHAALFATEYALAQLLASWGLEPSGLLGHSLGEYVAACLSGVFSLADALTVVVRRAQLIASLPSGAMLAVPLSEAELEPYLSADVALALVNGPELCVLAGPISAIAALEDELSAGGVVSRRVQNSHPLHTSGMNAIVADLVNEVGAVDLHPPQIPFVSNVTGDWISAEQATNPTYWGEQLAQTVRFADGLQAVWQQFPDALLVELGPGQSLSVLARQQVLADKDASEPLALSTLRAEYDHRLDDVALLLTTLGRLWVTGCPVDWAGYYAHEARRRVPLPTYPFERRRYWVDAPARQSISLSGQTEGELLPDPPSLIAHPRPNLPIDYVTPDTSLEEDIAGIWQALLGLEQVGLHDNFLELGGHSLLAIQLAARLSSRFEVSFLLPHLLDAPTIADQARLVENLKRAQITDELTLLPVIVPALADRHEPFPLTEVQEAYWVGRSGDFELGNVATHGYAEIENDILVARFEAAWQRLIDRHDMLRLIILPDGRQQIVMPPGPYVIEVVDLRDLPSTEVTAQIEAVRQEMSHQIRSLEQWPLFDIRAFHLANGRTRYCLSFDLIVGDAGSWQLVFSELKQLCGRPDLALQPLELSFRDYVLAERALRDSSLYRRALDYWIARLPDFPPAPQLPLLRTPAEVDTPHFKRLTARLEPDIWVQLKAQAAGFDLTPSGVLLAAFAEVLGMWSKSQKFTLNLTIFNRLPLHPQVDQIAGDFTSLILLAVDNTSPNDSFADRARAMQGQLWRDLEHRVVTGVRVLRELMRLYGGQPGALMPVVFTSTIGLGESGQDASVLGQLAQLGDIAYAISQTPQVWLDHQVFEQGGALVFNWDAIEELFPPTALENMFSAYTDLLRQLASDSESWGQSYLPIVPPLQLERRMALNATAAPVPDTLAHILFEKQVTEQSDRLAVVDPRRTVTYDQLARLSRRIGRYLRDQGAAPDSLVAIVMDKGWEQIAAALGVMQSGAAYLPIDPDNPPERLQYLLKHGEVKVALTQSWLMAQLPWPDEVLPLAIDDDSVWADGDDSPLDSAQQPYHLAYVLYTSGSTGQPKGVMIEQRSLVNRLIDVNQRFEISADDRVLALTALHHDLSAYDMFGVLAAGGTLVLPAASDLRNPAHWVEQLNRWEVTLWNSVPAFMEMMVEYLAHVAADQTHPMPASLRLVLLSGDWIPVSLPERIRGVLPETRVISLGGPTETTIWDIHYPIDSVNPAWKSVPYGRPMTNARYYVLNEALADCPDWVSGELCIAGTGVARGYWGDDERTAASFIEHPRSGERLYRSGDLGRFLPDGVIEILGRKDFQLKIRGQRIEAGEIEEKLIQHPDIYQALVTATGQPGRQQLAAYIVSRSDTAPAAEDLIQFLAQKLPNTMIPSTFVSLSEFPLTPNGKVDRHTLLDLALPSTKSQASATAIPDVQIRIGQIVEDILEIDPPAPQDNLLMLGADSVDVIRLANLLESELDFRPKIDDFYRDPTIAGLATAYQQAKPVQESRLAGPAWLNGVSSLSATYDQLVDPDQRAAFSAEQRGLRRDLTEQSEIALPFASEAASGYQRRRSYRHFLLKPVPQELLGHWLAALKQTQIDDSPKYRYPSAGSLYPVQTYLYVKPGRVADLSAGTYYYHPVDHQLVSLHSDVELDRTVYSRLINRPIFDEAAFALYFIVDVAAIAPMYGDYSLPFSLLEAGYMGQLLMSTASQYGLGLCPVGDLEFDRVRPLFELQESHVLVHSMLGGLPDDSYAAARETEAENLTEARMQRLLQQVKNLSSTETEGLLNAYQATPSEEQDS